MLPAQGIATERIESVARELPDALSKANNTTQLDEIFLTRVGELGFETAGYIRIFGEGRFHGANFLFGGTAPGLAERYQAKRYATFDPVITVVCRSTHAFTLDEVAGASPESAPILADSRSMGLIDGLVTPVRAGFDELGCVLLGCDHLLNPGEYERLLLQAISETYGRVGLGLLPIHADPPTLTRRENECLRWVAAGRSDPQIGMILGLSPNTVHAHVESAKTKLGANSRAQLVLRAVMAGILRSDAF